MEEIIIKNRWSILNKIGEGSFGQVFKASIPKCYWFGHHDGFNCLTIDLLGPSLKDLQDSTKIIPLNTVIDFGCQLITCFKYMHNIGIVYRDLKPENLLLSYNQSHSLHVIDFGLATWWKNPKTNIPYPQSRHKKKIGTARYASIPVHLGYSHSPRDDLESLAYILLDLLRSGDLPWSGVVARSCKAGWDRVRRIKQEISFYDLCVGLPIGIIHFINYTKSLDFHLKPDYDHLTALLIGSIHPGPYSSIVKRINQKNNLFLMNEMLNTLPSTSNTVHHSKFQKYAVYNSSQSELV